MIINEDSGGIQYLFMCADFLFIAIALFFLICSWRLNRKMTRSRKEYVRLMEEIDEHITQERVALGRLHTLIKEENDRRDKLNKRG